MDWNNVNLESGYERDQNILDPMNFDYLLLLLQHNVRDINAESIEAEFLNDLEIKIQSAKDVFEANKAEILRKALEERNEQ